MGNLKYKQSHLAKGLCTDCSRPVVKGFTRCERHILSNRINCHQQVQKRIEEGRCTYCGSILNRWFDGSYCSCARCGSLKSNPLTPKKLSKRRVYSWNSYRSSYQQAINSI